MKTSLVILTALTILLTIGVVHNQKIVNKMESSIGYKLDSLETTINARVDFNKLRSLPAPVQKYFMHVLKDGQPIIKSAKFKQHGKLLTENKGKKWLTFEADYYATPLSPGFFWNAKIFMIPFFHIRVLDSYHRGIGSGLVRLLSLWTIEKDSDHQEINSGALHRYLAEAVWFPTALLPQSGVRWDTLDKSSAIATLSDHGVTISLEFRFNKIGEVVAVYSPGRWGKFEGVYKQAAWEGHYSDYVIEKWGMLVPRKGEVGWYEGNELQTVWKGEILEVIYK
ncbi:MAG: hypothetical protein H7281_01040 [Bacteriovorax sp.]|nr:hypothetical protein [Bacteriovorax sp.]